MLASEPPFLRSCSISARDLFDRRTRTTNELGHYTAYDFDKNGNVTQVARKVSVRRAPPARAAAGGNGGRVRRMRACGRRVW
jgi:hypothetical protein